MSWRGVSIVALAAASALLAGGVAAPRHALGTMDPAEWQAKMTFDDPAGRVGVITTGSLDGIDADHPFFKVRANGRACATCHRPSDAMSLSLDTVKKRWAAAGARDPLFAAYDGSNCPDLPQDDPASHSLLLNRGLFRISLPWPPRRPDGSAVKPEFDLEVVSDPTGCNTGSEFGLKSAKPRVSVYRRPRMAANLRYVATPKYDYNAKNMLPMAYDPVTGKRSSMSMMADGRALSLRWQVEEAMRTHLQMTGPLSPEEIARIVDFESRIYVAQDYSDKAGSLTQEGSPKALGARAMAEGKDHLNGNDIDTGVFFFFDQWKKGANQADGTPEQRAFRESVARGYDIFFFKGFWISDTFGINNIRIGNPYKQTCAFCHNTQLTGTDDVPGWMDLGTTNLPQAVGLDDLPLFKVTCHADVDPHPYRGREIYTSDPGRALISGKCEDVGSVVMQQFRGIAARAPYFVNGSANSLDAIVDFYDRRYNIGFTDQERRDLVNFLSVL